MNHTKKIIYKENDLIITPKVRSQEKILVTVGRRVIECKTATKSYDKAVEVFLHGKRILCSYMGTYRGWVAN